MPILNQFMVHERSWYVLMLISSFLLSQSSNSYNALRHCNLSQPQVFLNFNVTITKVLSGCLLRMCSLPSKKIASSLSNTRYSHLLLNLFLYIKLDSD